MCSTLRGLRAQKVVKRAAELAGGDFTLADLEDCTVLLLGRLPALRILRATRCCIVAGPVDGAAYLEGVHTWLVLLQCAWIYIVVPSRITALAPTGMAVPEVLLDRCNSISYCRALTE